MSHNVHRYCLCCFIYRINDAIIADSNAIKILSA